MTEIAEESVAPLVKVCTVPLDPTRVFELFTAHMNHWWPRETHSVGQSDAVAVTFQGQVGGQITETLSDGRTEVWGTVTAWKPPEFVVFTWHPGRSEQEATAVTVRFAEVADGTLVELTHAGWAARPDSADSRRGYDTGWDLVLGCFERLARAGGPSVD